MKQIYNDTVLWRGTAEVSHKLHGEDVNSEIRVDAALVATPKQKKEKILFKWEGVWISANTITSCREFEDKNTGELVCDISKALTDRINSALLQNKGGYQNG